MLGNLVFSISSPKRNVCPLFFGRFSHVLSHERLPAHDRRGVRHKNNRGIYFFRLRNDNTGRSALRRLSFRSGTQPDKSVSVRSLGHTTVARRAASWFMTLHGKIILRSLALMYVGGARTTICKRGSMMRAISRIPTRCAIAVSQASFLSPLSLPYANIISLPSFTPMLISFIRKYHFSSLFHSHAHLIHAQISFLSPLSLPCANIISLTSFTPILISFSLSS